MSFFICNLQGYFLSYDTKSYYDRIKLKFYLNSIVLNIADFVYRLLSFNSYVA